MATERKIAVLTDDATGMQRSALPSFSSTSRQVSEVATEVISSNLDQFLRSFEEALDGSVSRESSFAVDQIELNLVINAQGGIELIGKVNAGVTASFKVTLKRKKQD